jgi:glucose-6-phosphate 1-dehydrogenase
MKKNRTTLVIFGITGDLSRRYLLPALAAIEQNKQLPDEFRLTGVSRRSVAIKDVLPKNCQGLAKFIDLIQMDLENKDDYKNLAASLEGDEVIFYFAVPPDSIMPIVQNLASAGLNKAHHRLLLEKPFGVDYESAKNLINETAKCYKDEQIYRIDHYLAKEMAQNIAVFLGGNVIFRSLWSNQFIDHVEIVVSEKIDIEGRAGFYEKTGAMRDIVQSHLLQLTALVLMKPCPDVFDFSELPARRLEALSLLKPADSSRAYRAQYDGYRTDVDNPSSTVETFVSIELESKDPKWQGVPIKLVTGKAMHERLTEIVVYFKRNQMKEANKLTMRIQPREGIELDLWVKKPGYDHEIEKLPLDFNYEQHFGSNLPDAYEKVLVDAMRSRQNLFAGSEEILAAWWALDPIIQKWAKTSADLKTYKKGSTIKQVLASSV